MSETSHPRTEHEIKAAGESYIAAWVALQKAEKGFRGQWNKKQRQGWNPYGTWISGQTFLIFVTLIIPEAYTRQWI